MTRQSASPRFVSDQVVDLLVQQGIKYVSFNPGSTCRGLHESLVNYGAERGSAPELLVCPNENLAIGVAHGYAKASGEPMAVMLHDVVGLLRGAMNVYWAYLDRVPMLLLGGTGPVRVADRRDYIDWIHTANVQGSAVREYTKWDDQPCDPAGLFDSLSRAYRMMSTQPQGPVYLAVDVGLQFAEADQLDRTSLDPRRLTKSTPWTAGSEALNEVAGMLMSARRPVLIAGFVGRDPRAFDGLVQLAELTGAGVWDTNIRLSFPNRHPLNVTGSDALEGADLVVLLDVRDLGDTAFWNFQARHPIELPSTARVVDVGFHDVGTSSWSQDFGPVIPSDLRVSADACDLVLSLIPIYQQLIRHENCADLSERRARVMREYHHTTWESFEAARKGSTQDESLGLDSLATVVWDQIRDEDWVLTAGTAKDWALRTWDFDKPYRHPGKALATATQIGLALGVALAHKGTGRLVIDLQPDGDLLFDPAALWVASYHQIPLLVIVINNRAYWTDWIHQKDIARGRGRDTSTAYVGMELDRPAPDYAGLARSLGWHAEGPVGSMEHMRRAIEKASAVVLKSGAPALVDVVCRRE